MPHSIVLIYCPLKSSNTNYSFSVFLILYTYFGNTPKALNKIRSKPQKPLVVHGDNGDFRVDLFLRNRLRIHQKYFSQQEEYAESI
jgi:hypothetical protein